LHRHESTPPVRPIEDSRLSVALLGIIVLYDFLCLRAVFSRFRCVVKNKLIPNACCRWGTFARCVSPFSAGRNVRAWLRNPAFARAESQTLPASALTGATTIPGVRTCERQIRRTPIVLMRRPGCPVGRAGVRFSLQRIKRHYDNVARQVGDHWSPTLSCCGRNGGRRHRQSFPEHCVDAGDRRVRREGVLRLRDCFCPRRSQCGFHAAR